MEVTFSRRLRKWLAILGALVLIGLALGFVASARLTPFVRERFIKAVGERFQSEVSLANFHVSVIPRIRVTGEGLVLRHKHRTDAPPMIRIRSFSAHAGILGLLMKPRRVRMVRLDGLHIELPPRERKEKDFHDDSYREEKKTSPVLIEEIVAEDAVLEMLPKQAGKVPLDFQIHRVRMQSVAGDRPAPFYATLRNPKPRGDIEAQGQFGPWEADEPSLTQVSGMYTFKNADLATFRGIAGILTSEGKFNGVLERIEVQGETDMSNFS